MVGPGREDTLGARLEARSRERFVGRIAERELFEAALGGIEEVGRVLFIHGPGGVGKSCLLDRLGAIASGLDASVVRVDGRVVPGTVERVSQVIAPVLRSARTGGLVLLVDAYERLEGLDGWFREALLPGLPGDVVVVMASRRPPSSLWRADPAWRELLRVVSLRNLDPDEASCYLASEGVPNECVGTLVALTHGHPFALSLVADVVARGGDPAATGLPPDVVTALVGKLVDDVPSPDHRRALQICAIARVTNEPLLRDVLGRPDVAGVFEWLAGLSCVEPVADGLAPHDLARDVLDVDLRWRDRATYDDVFRAVRCHVHRRLRTTRGVDQQRAIFDEKFVFRNLPTVLSPVDWTSWGDAYPQPARPSDAAQVLEMIEAHEGEQSGRIAARWWDEQPEGFYVVRDGERVQGGLVLLTLTSTVDFDPGAQAAWTEAARQAPLRPGEVMTQTRFVVDRDRYQAPSPTLNATPVITLQRYLHTANLSWDFLTLAEPDAFDDYFAVADMQRAASSDFVVGGRRYGLFAHDFRRVPVDEWLELITERALAQELATTRPAGDEPLVLSHVEFDAAVRRALRDLHRADQLSHNPLCRTRLVRPCRGDECASALAELVHEAARQLQLHPRDQKRWRAIDRTYLRPCPTQERAAELLDVPFSTYRRHLTEGVAKIVEHLWTRELHGDVARDG